ncbi:tripartite tricarboxylate transporter substrate binding protein [Cupriavidus sp. D384]|uniref:Bug family tripartite tricarboxylate transporter substrate binding protein n=1 Tax=Cupriavidus sp. D384 TaxID=1538095 RepID=UPI0008317249|nr:tripartite tricarboxylate transporter substrate binding protein [Cupriavidus sp. D384]
MHRRWLSLFAAAAFAATFAPLSHGAEYPNKPIRLVVGFPPGGASDVVARLLQPSLQQQLGQPIVIENRPGANGNLANEAVARADPDGYTLLLGNPGPLVLNPYLYKRVAIDPAKAFTPVTQLTESPMVIVVPAKSSVKTMRDLLEKARRNPGKLTYGSAGNGSSMHVAGATLQMRLNAPLIHVPYKGSGPAINDLLGGQLDFMPDSRSTTLPLIRDGRLRALAVTGSHRVSDLPDVPTVAESGLPGFDVTTWLGVVAPAGTPTPIVLKLYKAFNVALKDPTVDKRLNELGTGVKGSKPEEFAKALEGERQSARQLVQKTGMSIE